MRKSFRKDPHKSFQGFLLSFGAFFRSPELSLREFHANLLFQPLEIKILSAARYSMKKFLIGFLLILISSTYLWGKVPEFIPSQSLALVFSSNSHGEVEPCG